MTMALGGHKLRPFETYLLQSIFLDPVLESPYRYSEHFRGFFPVSFDLREDIADSLPFASLQQSPSRRRSLTYILKIQVLCFNSATGNDKRTLNHILKLTDVPRPVIFKERRFCGVAKAVYFFSKSSSKFFTSTVL